MPWWTKGTFIILLNIGLGCTSNTPKFLEKKKPGGPEEYWAELLYSKSELGYVLDKLSLQGFKVIQIGQHDFELYTEQDIPSWLDSLFQIGYTYKADKGYLVYRPRDVNQRFRRIEIQPYPEKKAYALLFEPSPEF
jgi:hypothetical protein